MLILALFPLVSVVCYYVSERSVRKGRVLWPHPDPEGRALGGSWYGGADQIIMSSHGSKM